MWIEDAAAEDAARRIGHWADQADVQHIDCTPITTVSYDHDSVSRVAFIVIDVREARGLCTRCGAEFIVREHPYFYTPGIAEENLKSVAERHECNQRSNNR